MQKKRHTHGAILLIFTLSILSFANILVSPDWSFGIVLMQTIGTLLILTILSMCMFDSLKMIHIVLAVFLFLISWWFASTRDQAIYRYGQIAIANGDSYFFYDAEKHSVQKTISDENIRIKDRVRAQNKNLSYTPIAVPGKTCSEGTAPKYVETVIKTTKPVEDIKTSFLFIKNKGQSFDGQWWETNATIIMSPCLPEPLTIIDDTLRQDGFDFYVMVNPIFYDESIAN